MSESFEIAQIEAHDFGLWHHTWSAPSCFYFKSAEEAQESILKVYGPEANHVVVERLQRVGRPANVIDAAHIEHQRAWSAATFGPRNLRGPSGPLAHIRKEVEEVAADPSVLEEWIDVIILAFDGAWRAGHEPQQIIDAVKAKQAKNEARTWPDWRGIPSDQAIEHVEPKATA